MKVLRFRTNHPVRVLLREHDLKSSWSISAIAHKRAKPFWLYRWLETKRLRCKIQVFFTVRSVFLRQKRFFVAAPDSKNQSSPVSTKIARAIEQVKSRLPKNQTHVVKLVRTNFDGNHAIFI